MKTLIFQNSNENIVRISALKVFKIWQISYAQHITVCPPGFKKLFKPLHLVYKNFQGRNPYNIFVAILENQCLYKFFLSLSDL